MQRLQCGQPQSLSLQQDPFLESRRAADVEPGQKLALVQIDGGCQLGGIGGHYHARRRHFCPLNRADLADLSFKGLHVQPIGLIPVEGDLLARDGQVRRDLLA